MCFIDGSWVFERGEERTVTRLARVREAPEATSRGAALDLRDTGSKIGPWLRSRAGQGSCFTLVPGPDHTVSRNPHSFSRW